MVSVLLEHIVDGWPLFVIIAGVFLVGLGYCLNGCKWCCKLKKKKNEVVAISLVETMERQANGIEMLPKAKLPTAKQTISKMFKKILKKNLINDSTQESVPA